MNEQTTPAHNYPLRLPPDLRRALQREADQQHRSLHAHIIHVLTEAVAKPAHK